MASLMKPLGRFGLPRGAAEPVPGVADLFERFEREDSEPLRDQLAIELFGLLSAASRLAAQPADAR